MLEVLPLAAPVFVIIALGWLFRWRGWIADDAVRALNDFIFRLPLPALMFVSASSAGAVGGDVPLAYFAACLPVYALGVLLGRWALGLRLVDAGLFGLNAAFGNTVMMGLPLVLAVFGRAGVDLMLGIIALHAVILLPPAIILAEVAGNAGAGILQVFRSTVVSILRNPIILAVVGGTIWLLLLPPLPAPVLRTLEMIGAAAPSVALFTLGAGLVGNSVGRRWAEPVTGVILKLLVLPAMVWLAARWLGLSPIAAAVAVTTAGLPTGANAVVLARRYAAGGGSSGAMVLVGTVLSVATLAVIITFTRPG